MRDCVSCDTYDGGNKKPEKFKIQRFKQTKISKTHIEHPINHVGIELQRDLPCFLKMKIFVLRNIFILKRIQKHLHIVKIKRFKMNKITNKHIIS